MSLQPGDSPGFLLWRVTLRWQREMVAALRPLGLTHVQFVLLASAWWLGRDGVPPTQRELASHAGADAMMTSQVLRALERRGLLERRTDTSDRRVRRIALTAEGTSSAERALAVVEAADAEFFAAAESRDDVLRVLRSLAS